MIYDPTPRLVKIGDALSQLGNVIWPFWDHRDTTANESISGRCYREGRWFRHVIDAIFFWQYCHCEGSHDQDVKRARMTIDAYERKKND